jgi:hypothetical protein
MASDELARNSLVRLDNNPFGNFPHEVVALVGVTLLVELRSSEVHAKICAVRDLEPVDLARILIPPVISIRDSHDIQSVG